MVAVTYGVGRVPAAEAAPKTAAPRKSWLVRFYNALIESRMKRARQEIRMHAHLLPANFFDAAGERTEKARSGDMPFGGW